MEIAVAAGNQSQVTGRDGTLGLNRAQTQDVLDDVHGLRLAALRMT